MNDKDLTFLNGCSNEQLRLFTDFLIFDEKGNERWTEELTIKKGFKENYPNNLVNILPDIVNEFQKFGGNTFFNLFRGHGVSYREILEKVCKKLDVNFNKNNSTELLEQYLLQKFLVMSVEKMTEEDVYHLSNKLTKSALKEQIGLLQAGSPLFIKLTTMLVAGFAKKYGLKQAASFAAKFAGSRTFAILAGPIGWAITGLWTAFDIAGPAYRVLVPCTVTIAYLRNIYDKSEYDLNEILG